MEQLTPDPPPRTVLVPSRRLRPGDEQAGLVLRQLDDRTPEPELPPAVGTLRATRTDVVMTTLLSLALAVGYALWRGLRSLDVVDDLALWVLLPAVAIGARTARIEVSVGPGWVSSRGWSRRHWVRTDRLVRVEDVGRCVVDRLLVLADADADGRRASVSLRDLSREPALWRRFVADVERSLAAGADATLSARRLLEDQGKVWRPPGRRGR